jgi:hypothetical protein
MKKILFLGMALAMLVLFNTTTSQAISIGFDPVSQDVMVGDQADVELVISGLGDFAPPSLSTFDLDVIYDPSILSINDVVFGPYLGTPNDPVLDPFCLDLSAEACAGFGTVGPGAENVFEVSLLLDFELDPLQPSSFTLATLTFDTLALGTSPLDITINALGDAWGDPLLATTESGSVNVIAEPATLLLLGSGLAGIGYLRRKRIL